MKATDWLVRTLLLVLSGMATLSVIGAIAAIPSPGLPRPFADPAAVERISDAAPDGARAGSSASTAMSRSGSEPAGIAAPAPPPPSPWLESLTYAVIALAGFAAAALVVLLRIAGHLGTIARRDRM